MVHTRLGERWCVFFGVRGFSSHGSIPRPFLRSELRDDLAITFQTETHFFDSKVHAAYGRYKAANAVGEARALGTPRSMIKYDIDKGYAVA